MPPDRSGGIVLTAARRGTSERLERGDARPCIGPGSDEQPRPLWMLDRELTRMGFAVPVLYWAGVSGRTVAGIPATSGETWATLAVIASRSACAPLTFLPAAAAAAIRAWSFVLCVSRRATAASTVSAAITSATLGTWRR